MKTTVHIPDSLFKAAQKLAVREGSTLKALVSEGLQRVIKERSTEKPFRLEDFSVGGNGLSPEFKHAGWEQFREAVHPQPKGLHPSQRDRGE
jgi:hypothetical protein